MTSSPLVAWALACVALVGCAEGAKIADTFQTGSGEETGNGGAGDGGRRGDGGRQGGDGGGDGDGDGDGGDRTSGPTSSSHSASSTVTSATSNSASISVSSASAQSSSASSSAAQSTAAATTSSTGGGPIECNAPLDPAGDCGAGQHCWPEPAGTPPECSPAGAGTQYATCGGELDCAPIYGCLGIVEGEGACCLQFCTDDIDCPGFFDLCSFFTTSLFAGGVEYGVCFDGEPQGC